MPSASPGGPPDGEGVRSTSSKKKGQQQNYKKFVQVKNPIYFGPSQYFSVCAKPSLSLSSSASFGWVQVRRMHLILFSIRRLVWVNSVVALDRSERSHRCARTCVLYVTASERSTDRRSDSPSYYGRANLDSIAALRPSKSIIYYSTP
jgi:hypothetical protein